MKKYNTYLGILAVGLLLGWLLFGNSRTNETEHSHSETEETNRMWTCSMHPQIMQPEDGDCPICGMELIPAEISADGLTADQFKLTENAMALANIMTTIVGESNGEGNVIKLSGKIDKNEKENVVQVSYLSGRIERLYVSFTGEKVSKGQLLATIYSPELYSAQQELITASSLKESQPVLYKAVRNKLKLMKLSEKQINEIETTGKVKEIFPVYATVSGTVTDKLVEQGDYIKQGQPLLKIANLNTVWANFDVYENQIELLKKGQEVDIKINSYPNEGFKGKVSFIDPVLNTRTRTVKLRVVLNNTNDKFKPGMFVEGKIKGVSSNKVQLLSIPSAAVLWTGERSVIYLKSNPTKPFFEMREVKLGNKIGENYEVLSGLQNGDEIVTNGTFTIDAAAQLQGKKSMMNKGGGKVMTVHMGHKGMSESTSSDNSNHSKMYERIKVPEVFQNQLKTTFDNYLVVKDALVKDDSKKVVEGARQLLNSLNLIDMKLLKDNNEQNHWMKLEKELKYSTKSIIEVSNLEEQRNHFKYLSSHLSIAIQLYGVNEKVYNQFCPMANNNKGAYWLSKEEQILNPYFGEDMLKCGEIIQTID